MAHKLLFEIKKFKNDICYGKLYLKLPYGEKDISEIMVEMGKAYSTNRLNQLTNTTGPSAPEYVELVRTSGEAKNNSKSDTDSSSTVTLSSDKTVEQLDAHESNEASKIMSVYNDDSVKSDEIAETQTLAPVNRTTNLSKDISLCDDIPAYLLEDGISEIGAEKYSIPRNSNPLKKIEIEHEIVDMKALLKDAIRMNRTFQLPKTRSTQSSQLLFFHHRINKHLKQMRSNDPNDAQEKMWSTISKETCKKIHIVGDTHYIMYLPAICDTIYVGFPDSLVLNNRLLVLL